MEAKCDCCMDFACGASMCNTEGLPAFENSCADCYGCMQSCNYASCLPLVECDPYACMQGFVAPPYPYDAGCGAFDNALCSYWCEGCYNPVVPVPCTEQWIDTQCCDVPQLVSRESVAMPNLLLSQPEQDEHNEGLYHASSLTLPCGDEPLSAEPVTTTDSNQETFIASEVQPVQEADYFQPQLPATSLTESSSETFSGLMVFPTATSFSTPAKVVPQRKARHIQDAEDTDWADTQDTDTILSSGSRNRPVKWSPEECQRLREAVENCGATLRWSEVAKYVGTRTMGQCINKWKNSLCKKRERWTAQSSEQLKELLKKGLSEKEIARLMPQFTYIQLYQQIRKLSSNTKPWAQWEVEKLVKLKQEGTMGDTEIGRCLDNRHRDAVKNMWNHIRKQQGF